MKPLLTSFLVEAAELSAKVTRSLLAIERSAPDSTSLPKNWESLARGLHTLKGTSATLGLATLSQLAHRMEDVLAVPRQAVAPLEPELADAVLQALDGLLSHIRVLTQTGGETDLGSAFELLGFKAPQSPQAEVAPEAVKPESAAGPETRPEEDGSSWRIEATQVASWMREAERLREMRLRLDERRRELEHAIAVLESVPGSSAARALLGSLSITLTRDGEDVGDIVDSLEEGLKSVCTLKVRVLVDPLERLCRDLCRTLGKRARLSLVGGEVAIDRRLLEGIRGPLVQLLKNALDHGVEPPEAREKAGKHLEASLTLRFELEGNMLFVELADDGRGLDLDRIRQVAADRGLAAAAVLERMEKQALFGLLFTSGFSSRADVTDTSGRGVGLDVVKTEVERLSGKVEVQSVPGQGTRFILTLPSDLGSSPTLVVRAGEHFFGLPMASIESVRPARSAQIKTSARGMQLAAQGELLPLRDLGALLELRQSRAPFDGQPLLLLRTPKGRLAIAVDEIQGDRELVIRPLPAALRRVAAYQGAAANAKGGLLLVLRPDWLAEQSKAAVQGKDVRRALVVDDSLTARALHRTMLEAGGFLVYTASSGAQALDQLRQGPVDVLVSDIAMEEMDGVALTTAVRRLPEARDVPVILVSAFDSEGERTRGREAGADGFLSKADCASGRLLNEVAAVIARRRGAA